jgi:hypothetical protein
MSYGAHFLLTKENGTVHIENSGDIFTSKIVSKMDPHQFSPQNGVLEQTVLFAFDSLVQTELCLHIFSTEILFNILGLEFFYE